MRSGKARFILSLGSFCLSWATLALGSDHPPCPRQLELRAQLESVWSALSVKPPSLNFDEAFALTVREAERTLRGRVLTRKDLLDPIEEFEFQPVLPLLVTPVLETFLNENPKATEPLRQKLEGLASDRVVIVVHAVRSDFSSIEAYLKSEPFRELPVLALVSTYYPLSDSKILSHLTMARYSHEGELRGVQINADEVHLMGGAFGDCLTTATGQALNQMLSFPHRDKAIAHLHLQASWGWKRYSKEWVRLPQNQRGERLFKDFNDRTEGCGYPNEALDPFKFVKATSVRANLPYFEMKLERVKDGKKAFVRLYGIPLKQY